MVKTMVLLGAPCVGKSTLSFALHKNYPQMRAFSVRLFTQQLLRQDSPFAEYLRRENLVQPKKYLPDDVVEQIFGFYLDETDPQALLLVEGFPINRVQLEGMKRQMTLHGRSIDGVFVLEDTTEAILQRRRARKVCPACEQRNGAGLPILPTEERCPYCGGLLEKRPDDEEQFFLERLVRFEEEQRFIQMLLPEKLIHRIFVSQEDPLFIIQNWIEET